MKAFYEIDASSFTNQLSEKIKNEISGKGKEYVLKVDEEEFKKYLVESFTLEPLQIDRSSEVVHEPRISKEYVQDHMFRQERYERDVYTFTVSYAFTGTPVLFRVRPHSWVMTTANIDVNENTNMVSFSFKLYKKDPDEFMRTKGQFYGNAFANISNVNELVSSWNNGLAHYINSTFENIKSQYQKENDFFAAINVKVNQSTSSIFSAPTVKKKVIPQPVVDNKKEFSSQPTMSKEMYDDILRVVYDSGKNMEKKPALYQGKDEEGLRDQFLFVLETRYEGTTATGETFNRGGKTDIILKYAKDGSNLFVAECKFWHGPSECLKAVSQLFDRYLSWRDSKAALILFVTNKDFSNTISAMKAEIAKHPYYISENGARGETSFSYIFHLPQDKNKHVFFEIMMFHYDK